jgi:hypothetical protein
LITTDFEPVSAADSATYRGVIYMQVNDSSYPVGGDFGTQGIQDSGSSQPAADQGASSQGAGRDDLTELLRKMLMQAEQQRGSQGQGSQAGNGDGGGGQIQF